MAYAFFVGGHDTDYIENRIHDVRKKFGKNFVTEQSTEGDITAEQVHWNRYHEKGRGELPAVVIGNAKTLDEALFGEPTWRLVLKEGIVDAPMSPLPEKVIDDPAEEGDLPTERVPVPNVIEQGFDGKVVLFEGGHGALQKKLWAVGIEVTTIHCPSTDRTEGARGVFQRNLEKELEKAGVEPAERVVAR